jgi:hypothetical protein
LICIQIFIQHIEIFLCKDDNNTTIIILILGDCIIKKMND